MARKRRIKRKHNNSTNMVNTSQSRPVNSRLSLRKNEGVHVQSDDEFEYRNVITGDRSQDDDSTQVEKCSRRIKKRSHQCP